MMEESRLQAIVEYIKHAYERTKSYRINWKTMSAISLVLTLNILFVVCICVMNGNTEHNCGAHAVEGSVCASGAGTFEVVCDVEKSNCTLKCIHNAVSRSCVQPRDCQDLQNQTSSLPTGIYTIYPGCNDNGVSVRCDMTTDDGGWTVIQRRIDNEIDFFRDWEAYETGFGNLSTNYWLGNTQIHTISTQGTYELRVDMIGPNDEHKVAKYDYFVVGDAGSKYKLLIGVYNGDAGDSLSYQNRMEFSTNDQDNDLSPNNCAVVYTGAWWYNSCHTSNLNGIYGETNFGQGIVWKTVSTYSQSLEEVEMKIRRLWEK